jgi:hypothetical protein
MARAVYVFLLTLANRFNFQKGRSVLCGYVAPVAFA